MLLLMMIYYLWMVGLIAAMNVKLFEKQDAQGYGSYQTTDFSESIQEEVDQLKPKMPYLCPKQLLDMKLELMKHHNFPQNIISSSIKKYNKQKEFVQQQVRTQSDSISVDQYVSDTRLIQKRDSDLDNLIQQQLDKQSNPLQPINQRLQEIEIENDKYLQTKNDQDYNELDYFRFKESKEDVVKVEAQKQILVKLKILKVFASSVLTGRTKIEKMVSKGYYDNNRRYVKPKYQVSYKFYVYEAENIIQSNKGYWCSTGQHQPDDIVTMRIDLSDIRSVYYLLISWAYSPGYYQIQTSTDGEQFVIYTDWAEGAQGSDWRYLAKKFWDWKQHYQSYVQYIDMGGQYIKSIKILMKDNVFRYFGIYNVEVFTKVKGIMLRSMAEGGQDDCIVVSNQYKQYDDKPILMMMNCIKSIQMLEGREQFFIETNFQISTGIDRKMCLMPADGKLDAGTVIVIDDCGSEISKEWSIDNFGRIKYKNKEDMCLMSVTDETIHNVALNQNVKASSESSDSNYPGSFVVDGLESTYWKTDKGEKEAQIDIELDNYYIISKVTIKWHFVPKKYKVKIMTIYEQYETIYQTKNGKSKDVEILFVPIQANQLVISMSESQDEGQYGIVRVDIDNNMKQIQLQPCEKGFTTKTSRFIIDSSEFIDLTAKSKLIAEKKDLAKQGNLLDSILLKTIGALPVLEKLFGKARELKQRQVTIEGRLSDLDQKLNDFREYFDPSFKKLQPGEEQMQRQTSNLLGTNSNNPAQDCNSILAVFKHKISGYYWIKPECGNIPIRVYCDFMNGGGFYAYLGGIKEGDDYKKVVNNVNDVRFKCAQIGLEPLDVFSKQQMMLLQNYMLDLNINMKKEVVPLLHDYGCANDKCDRRYKSILGDSSVDMTQDIQPFIDKNNINNMDFSKEMYKIDGIGFAQNKGLLQYFEFGKFVAKGVLCSDNKFSTQGAFKFIEVDCSTIVRGNDQFDGILNSKVTLYYYIQVKVLCPKDCDKQNQFKVWGSILYKDDSSICRAAIHSGQLNAQTGGRIEVGVEKGMDGVKNQYKASQMNNVQTLDYSKRWDRSFVINKYVLVCPIANFKSRLKSSFIQTAERSSYRQSNSRRQSVKQQIRFVRIQQYNNNKLQSQQNRHDIVMDIGSNRNRTKHVGRVRHGDSQISSFIQTYSDSGFKSELELKDDQKQEGTDIAIEELYSVFKLEKKELQKYLKLQKDAQNFVITFNKLMSPLKTTDISGESLSSRLTMNFKHIQGTNNIQEIQLKDAIQRTKITYRLLQLTKLKKLKLRKWFKYEEKWEYLITDIYDIYDNPFSLNQPSQWKIDKVSIKGHIQTISQTSEIKCSPQDQCSASILTLKYKYFYDSIMKASIFMNNNEMVGIIFRFKDYFNHYVFEISQKEGFKRVRRVMNGESKIMAINEDGGFESDKWYRVIINMKQGIFSIQMGEENSQTWPEVLKFEDQVHVQGQCGFSVNANNGYYIDKFEFEPILCEKEVLASDTIYKGPQCSRFLENYYGQLTLRWRAMDPVDSEGGPSIWKIQENQQGRDKAIVQKSKIYSSGPDKIPSILELKYIDRFCKSGFVSFQFICADDGAVGIALRYQNQYNFYLLEFHGTKQKYSTFRKVIDGRYVMLSKDESFGYDLGIWYTINIFMSGSSFRVFVIKENEQPTMIFSDGVNDEDIKEGGIGLTTFKVRVVIDMVKMMPFGDLEKEEEEEEEEEQKELEEIKIKKAGSTPKMNKVYENDNSKKIQWKKCLLYKTLVERNKHCKLMYDFDQGAQENCQTNYCQTCCQNEIDILHKVHRLTCEKECLENGKQEVQGNPWQGCVSSSRPNKSVYSYCKEQFLEETDKTTCSVGFCDLCCINSEVIWKVSFDDKVMEACHAECRHVYGTKKEQDGLVE